MTLGLRLRLSLLVRMLVAVAILLPLALAVALLAGVLLALVGLGLAGWVFDGLTIVAAAPRPSAATGASPGPVALLSLLGLIAVYWGWPHVSRRTASAHLLPPDGLASALGLGWTLGCLYCFLVEGSAAIVALATALSSTRGWVVVALLSIALSTIAVVWGARREARRLRDRLVGDSVPAADAAPAVDEMTRQLAQLADAPVPDAYVTETDRPESFTVGAGAEATVVVSTGLVDALSRDELEAVLAHEVSHLANADSRLMTAALVPVILADDMLDETPRDPFDRFWNGISRALKWYGQLGIAILSRGREWGADAGAAALTGAPATLASALARLDDARATPQTDLREWEASVAAMDILPPAGADLASGPFRTHPPTTDRIDRLRELAARDEAP